MSSARDKSRRHVPTRTCAGCGERGPRRELRRFGISPDGRLEWRVRGGRGSYLHMSAECERFFTRQKKSVRGLRTKIAPEMRQELLATPGSCRS